MKIEPNEELVNRAQELLNRSDIQTKTDKLKYFELLDSIQKELIEYVIASCNAQMKEKNTRVESVQDYYERINNGVSAKNSSVLMPEQRTFLVQFDPNIIATILQLYARKASLWG